MRRVLVVAHFREHLDWLGEVSDRKIFVMNEDSNPPGREAYYYLHYLTENYFDCGDEIIFCQGTPFNHCANFLEQIKLDHVKTFGEIKECQPNGLPHCDWTPLHAWCEVLGLEKKDHYRFVAGAQFKLTRSEVFTHPQDFYRTLRYLCGIGTHWNNKAAWVMERLWGSIFPSLGLYDTD